jgi:hypothetical protein
MLDKTFIKEIKKAANGDGSREYRIAFYKELRTISAVLTNRYKFNDCIKEYGRAKVAFCVACTIIQDINRHESPQIMWAHEVMNLWTNRVPELSISAATINIHPAILSDNSYFLRQVTTINK